MTNKELVNMKITGFKMEAVEEGYIQFTIVSDYGGSFQYIYHSFKANSIEASLFIHTLMSEVLEVSSTDEIVGSYMRKFPDNSDVFFHILNWAKPKYLSVSEIRDAVKQYEVGSMIEGFKLSHNSYNGESECSEEELDAVRKFFYEKCTL